jgi:hypothetical protein
MITENHCMWTPEMFARCLAAMQGAQICLVGDPLECVGLLNSAWPLTKSCPRSLDSRSHGSNVRHRTSMTNGCKHLAAFGDYMQM